MLSKKPSCSQQLHKMLLYSLLIRLQEGEKAKLQWGTTGGPLRFTLHTRTCRPLAVLQTGRNGSHEHVATDAPRSWHADGRCEFLDRRSWPSILHRWLIFRLRHSETFWVHSPLYCTVPSSNHFCALGVTITGCLGSFRYCLQEV